MKPEPTPTPTCDRTIFMGTKDRSLDDALMILTEDFIDSHEYCDRTVIDLVSACHELIRLQAVALSQASRLAGALKAWKKAEAMHRSPSEGVAEFQAWDAAMTEAEKLRDEELAAWEGGGR